ncbi:MAG: hypothetical protein JO256_04725, partial [Alphaproteobacteria bacterium]|nr:hypothetical protein [Alphaproteobacteria bacterium]
CGGVLHQLEHPLTGWHALLEVLEPNGVMRIAVHSQRARMQWRDIQQRVREKGFDASDKGIRAARDWLKSLKDPSLRPLLEKPEFFTMGGCRHLLFPATENPLSPAQIADFLRRNTLSLIGLEVPALTLAAYRARFPEDAAATDLDNWAAFEQENPESFAGMIQFWVQLRG